MRLFNFILSKARSCNLYIPYTHEIYYGKRSESVSTSGSKKPKVAPRCLGVEVVSNGTGVVYEFSNSIVIIDANPALDSASSPGHQLESDEYTSNGVSASPPVEALHDRSPRGTKRSSDWNLGTSATTP